MIVYGSKMYFKSNVVKSFGECQYCGNYGEQVSYQAKKFGHLYFIPLIPLGPKAQVLNECKSCDMGAQVSLQELEPRLEQLKDQFKSWIMEIQDGTTEIKPEGIDESVNAGVLIAGILEDLYCLGEIESADSICEILGAGNLSFENQLVQGRWHEIQGDLQSASKMYQAAHEAKPDDPIPLFQLGKVEVKLGNTAGAEAAFGKYQQLHPEDLSSWIELAGLYERTKDFGKLVDTYDKLYKTEPAFRADKGMKKLYKKACKKSGRPGQFLDQL